LCHPPYQLLTIFKGADRGDGLQSRWKGYPYSWGKRYLYACVREFRNLEFIKVIIRVVITMVIPADFTSMPLLGFLKNLEFIKVIIRVGTMVTP